MRFKVRALVILGVIIAALVTAGGAAHASGGSGFQWNQNGTGAFINAWNGGPAVDAYSGHAGENDFTLISLGSGYGLEFSSGNRSEQYNGDCISDYGNNQNNARAGLVACSAVGVPWGSVFTLQGCSANGVPGYALRNNHWGGYLHASGYSGSAFYLNSSWSCFSLEGAD